jgi:hypothetical protein
MKLAEEEKCRTKCAALGAFTAFLLGLFLCTLSHGQAISNTPPPGIRLKDETIDQGRIRELDCVGSNVACTRSGGTGTITVSGGGAGGTPGSPLFTQTATTTVTATSEQTLLGSGAGSLTIPANWFVSAGDSLKVEWAGRLTTTTVPGTQRVRLKFGSTVILDTGAYSLVGSITDASARMITTITARTVGASGTVIAESIFESTGVALVANEAKMINTATITVDTTATQAVGLTNLFDTASNSISTETFQMYGPGSAVSSVNGYSGAVVLKQSDLKCQRTATAISYQALTTDCYIGVTDTTAARTITLPDFTTTDAGREFTIGDESNGATAIPIDVVAGGSDTFLTGISSPVKIDVSLGNATFYWTGTSSTAGWRIK